MLRKYVIAGAVLAAVAWTSPALAQDDEDAECLACHADAAELTKHLEQQGSERDVMSLLVDAEKYGASLHAKQTCSGCHFEFDDFPHDLEETESIGCGECHEDAVASYEESVHAHVPEDNGQAGATCSDCHGVHDILHPGDRDARLHPLNIYRLCGECHFDVDPATASVDDLLREPYTDDAHAQGVLKHGMTISATCASCHGGHAIRAKGDPDSLVARHHVEQVCAQCHLGIVEQYQTSVHFLTTNGEERKGATCSDCHKPHDLTGADDEFRDRTIDTCKQCHEERAGTFYKSYHGKRHSLDVAGGVATCEDCHGAHDIRPHEDPASYIHEDRIVDTCGKCHPGSHEEFTKYLVHADPMDNKHFRELNVAWWLMNGIILVTLALGLLHAVLWLIRATAAGEWKRAPKRAGERYIRRWGRSYVLFHLGLMTTVLVLAITGLPLHYAGEPWADELMGVFGGAASAGGVHRFFAVAIVGLVVIFLADIAFRFFVKREKGLFTGETTMLPRVKDLQDLWGNLRWFLFRGERPRYSRWTYWEKFDFWAVFWGMFVIGLSGLMLWFPVVATRYVPGWFLNVAVIVHGFEALLDIAFIFTVHVFHANLRPDKFPMDTMYLSGALPEGEFRHERPVEYEHALAEGKLEDMIVHEPTENTRAAAYLIGTIALAVGFFFVGAMVVALIQHGISG